MSLFAFNTKRAVASMCLIILALALTSCSVSKGKVLASLGKYEKEKLFTSGGFQDYTDYAKYCYSSARVEENEYLKKINEADLDTINTYLDDFEEWIEATKEADASCEIAMNYDFARENVDTEDYFYIDSKEAVGEDGSTSASSFEFYFFDTKTLILYYFHNNV